MELGMSVSSQPKPPTSTVGSPKGTSKRSADLENVEMADLRLNDQRLDRDALIAELETHRLEHSLVQSEKMKWFDDARKWLTFAVTAFGFTLAAIPLAIQHDLELMFLLFPAFFLVFFSLIRSSYRVIGRLTAYHRDVLSVRTTKILHELGGPTNTKALGWQDYWDQDPPFVASLLWIPLMAATSSVLVFIALCVKEARAPTGLEYALLLLNGTVLVRLAGRLSLHQLRGFRKQRSNRQPKVISNGETI